jgi:F0F1-type ATP synthase assembly protein I
VAWTSLPLYAPSPLGMIVLLLWGLFLALLSVTLAAFLPAWRISREEAAVSMRS